MPTARQQAALARRNARLQFSRSRIVEREFQTQLSAVGRQIGVIIKGFIDAGRVTDLPALTEAMDSYSILLGPWAAAVAAKMQARVAVLDKNAWTVMSRSIGSNLHRLIESAPIGGTLKMLQAEQVTLITSLPAEAGARVHQLTREAIVSGRRAEDVMRDILDSGKVSVNRARLIARTEVARTASLLTETRARHIGSDGYFWRTVQDSDVRSQHRALEGKFIRWNEPPAAGVGKGGAPQFYHAGQGPNCRCVVGSTLLGLQDGLRALWRAPFRGDIHRVTVAGVSFDCTPNHPILTARGWVAAKSLQRGDYVVQTFGDPVGPIEHDKYHRSVSFADLFEAVRIGAISTPKAKADFYGDIPCGDVDHVSLEFMLERDREAFLGKSVGDFLLPVPRHGFSLIPPLDAELYEAPGDGEPVDPIFSGESEFALSSDIGRRDSFGGEILSSVAFANTQSMRNDSPKFADFFGESVRAYAKSGSSVFDFQSRTYKFLPFENQISREDSLHVFTLNSMTGWYGVTPLNIISRNCFPEPHIPWL